MYRETTNQSEIRKQRTDQNQETTNRSESGINEPIKIRNYRTEGINKSIVNRKEIIYSNYILEIRTT